MRRVAERRKIAKRAFSNILPNRPNDFPKWLKTPLNRRNGLVKKSPKSAESHFPTFLWNGFNKNWQVKRLQKSAESQRLKFFNVFLKFAESQKLGFSKIFIFKRICEIAKAKIFKHFCFEKIPKSQRLKFSKIFIFKESVK